MDKAEIHEDSEGEDWLADVYDRYCVRLYAYLMSVVRRPEVAEDLLQEIFCRLASRTAIFGIREPEHYLFRAAHNAVRTWTRRKQRRDHFLTGLADVKGADQRNPNGGLSPEIEKIERALAMLPPEQAEVVHLKTHEGMTFAAIGNLVGCSLNTAASRYRYACEKLRRMLEESSDGQ